MDDINTEVGNFLSLSAEMQLAVASHSRFAAYLLDLKCFKGAYASLINWCYSVFENAKKYIEGSGRGSVGRAVASNTRGPLFKSSSIYIEHLFTRLQSTVSKRRK